MSKLLITEGNVIETFKAKKIDVLAHCSNCFCNMGSGIAKAIREEFPPAYAADMATLPGNINKLGTFSKGKIGDQYIANIYGQYEYGRGKRQLSYDSLDKALREVALFMDSQRLKSIGIPYKFGSDRAGGNWEVVEAIFNAAFEEYDFMQVIAYRLPGA